MARKDVNQITGRASELVLESELTARGVEGLGRVGMGAGYAAGTATREKKHQGYFSTRPYLVRVSPRQ